MNELPLFDDFERIVLEQRPLIDTRAPVEFAEGAFPGTVNLPLMTDAERAAVGTCYKQHGNDAAVRLGHELVNETVRRPRIEAWAEFQRRHPDALLYCFRGGQRSAIAQRWLAEYAGQVIPRLRGGYKAFRRYLIDQLAGPLPAGLQRLPRFVLGGLTGVGKTRLLKQLVHVVDLEGLAHHRGSAFGRHLDPQPTPIAFENALAYALIRFLHADHPWLLFEDEGKRIGALNLPAEIYHGLYEGARRIVLEAPLETRIDITLAEYVTEAQSKWLAREPENGLERWHENMRDSFQRIRKRLGGARHQELLRRFELAWQYQRQHDDPVAHRDWIAYLLTEYYDPMYAYQMARSPLPIAFRGEAQAVRQWLAEQEAATPSV